jgi:hypothetical protein
MEVLGKISSDAFRPPAAFQRGLGRNSGGMEALSRVKEEKFCSRRMIIKDISEYANYARKMSKTAWQINKRMHLLSQTDPRPCVEGKEYERSRHQILLKAVIQEPIWVKYFRCKLS